MPGAYGGAPSELGAACHFPGGSKALLGPSRQLSTLSELPSLTHWHMPNAPGGMQPPLQHQEASTSNAAAGQPAAWAQSGADAPIISMDGLLGLPLGSLAADRQLAAATTPRLLSQHLQASPMTQQLCFAPMSVEGRLSGTGDSSRIGAAASPVVPTRPAAAAAALSPADVAGSRSSGGGMPLDLVVQMRLLAQHRPELLLRITEQILEARAGGRLPPTSPVPRAAHSAQQQPPQQSPQQPPQPQQEQPPQPQQAQEQSQQAQPPQQQSQQEQHQGREACPGTLQLPADAAAAGAGTTDQQRSSDGSNPAGSGGSNPTGSGGKVVNADSFPAFKTPGDWATQARPTCCLPLGGAWVRVHPSRWHMGPACRQVAQGALLGCPGGQRPSHCQSLLSGSSQHARWPTFPQPPGGAATPRHPAPATWW
jgi:hypothetical protein